MTKLMYNYHEHERIILGSIVALGLALRLYGIGAPLLDSHQIRQAQTAMMTRNLHDDNMNIFRTRLDFFGNGPGYIIMEFPVLHGITALLYYLFGVHEIIGRLVSVAFSIGTFFMMYGLARYFLSVGGALAALGLFVLSPMHIFFSRAFMPESSVMFFSVAAIYLIIKWLDDKRRHLYIAAILCAALAYLSKPNAGVILAPIIAAWFHKYRWESLKRSDFWLYIVLSIGPFILWGFYANHFNALNSELSNGFEVSWLGLLAKGGMLNRWVNPRFYTFVGGSIILLLLTPLGFIGSVAGMFCAARGDRRNIVYVWLAVIVIYYFALARIHSGHIYYSLPLLPLGVILFGFSVEWLLGKHDSIKKVFKRKTVACFSVCTLLPILAGYGFGYYKFFSYMYDTDLRMPYALEVADIIKGITSEGRVIILNQPFAMPAVVTYYAECKTWYFQIKSDEKAIEELEDLRARGATTYVAIDTKYGSGVKDTEQHEVFSKYLKETYRPIALTEHYAIYNLIEPKS